MSFDDWLILTWSLGCTGFFEPIDAAEHLDGAVGDHLVGVHVGLRAGAGLPDDQREMVVELAVDDFLRRLDDRLAELRVEPAELHVGFGRGALDDAERAHDRQRLLFPADLEIAERALRLRAPVAVGRDLDRAERIGLGPGFLLAHGLVSGSVMSATAYPVARMLQAESGGARNQIGLKPARAALLRCHARFRVWPLSCRQVSGVRSGSGAQGRAS